MTVDKKEKKNLGSAVKYEKSSKEDAIDVSLLAMMAGEDSFQNIGDQGLFIIAFDNSTT